MTENAKRKSQLLPVAGVVWCVVVAGAYYAYNSPYYSEKISTFARFFLGLAGF